ncbi:hypothetical protein E4U12_007175 [Claviceps purpurea]|nr:hypothetical protein E4U12_007175 [Claviceps purpurea]
MSSRSEMARSSSPTTVDYPQRNRRGVKHETRDIRKRDSAPLYSIMAVDWLGDNAVPAGACFKAHDLSRLQQTSELKKREVQFNHAW